MRNLSHTCLLLVAAAFLAGCGHRTGGASPAYARALAQAKRAGLPVTMAEMQVPPPPDAQNAAPLYVRLTRRLSEQPIGPEDKIADDLAKGALPSPEQLAAARAALARRADLVSLVHRAAARPRCVFVRDWTSPDPSAITFPELLPIRTGARLLTAESLVMASQGRGAEAVHNEALGFRLARQADSDHALIGGLMGAAVDAITLSGFRKILWLTHGDPAAARAVRQSIERDWQPPDMAADMRTEVAFQQGIVAMLRRTGPIGLDRLDGNLNSQSAARSNLTQALAPDLWPQTLDSGGTYLLGLMPRAVAAAGLPYPQAHAAMRAVTDEALGSRDTSHLLAVVLFPAADTVVLRRAQVQAQAAVTRAGAALLEYRASHGAFPAVLGGALSPVPPDPFDGRPLRYKHQGPDFVVYSVGPGGDFDGGTPFDRPDTKQSLFRYPCPPYDAATR